MGFIGRVAFPVVMLLFMCFANAPRIEASNRFSLLDRTAASGDENMDCERAFKGNSLQRSAGGSSDHRAKQLPAAAHVGLLHSHGPCARAAAPARPSTLSELAIHISRRDQYRVESLKLSAAPSTSAAGFASAQGPVASARSLGSENYILKVGLGTPGKDLILTLDTGSVVSWTQCLPCSSNASCYSQQDPIFDPAQSSSYSHVACGEAACTQLNMSGSAAGCSSPTSSCSYSILYGDNSTTTGDLASDTLTIGNFTLPNFTFGCGHDNEGLFRGVDGLLGLGQTSLSLPGQTVATFGGRFSYCLPSILQTNSSGFIEFGLQKNTSSSLAPLIKNEAAPFFYFVWLQGITVGATKLSIPALQTPPPTNTTLGGTIVDSGTVISRISSSFYTLMRDTFRNGTTSLPSAQSPASETLFDTCYNVSSLANLTIFPQLTFHFFNGLDFTLPLENTLIPVDNVGTACLAFAESPKDFTIIGNYQQQGFLFTFDTVASTLGIDQSAAC